VPMSRRRDSLPTPAPHGPDAGHAPRRTRPALSTACGPGDGVVTLGEEPAPYTGAAMSGVLSAHAAAARLGVSDRTVRRWIAAGRLRADKAAGEFQIALEDLATLTGHGAAAAAAAEHTQDTAAASAAEGSRLNAAPAAATSDLSALVALIERQQAQLLERTEAAAMWQARARMLEERVLALEAPRPEPEPAPDPFPAPIPSTPNAAPWWRRWVPWLAGAGVLAVVASASCQTGGIAASRQNLCPAAQQYLAFFDRIAGNGRESRSEGTWLVEGGWEQATMAASFIKNYC